VGFFSLFLSYLTGVEIGIGLMFCVTCRCRTCRKRKTRCDGKRPLCSTCTENGHECLGYAEVGEGNVKKERRDGGTPMRRAEDDGEDEEEDKSAEDIVGRGESEGH